MAGGRIGQAVGLSVILARHVVDGEAQGTGQFPANPVQRIQTRAAALVFASHLSNHYFRVRIDMQDLSLEIQCALQCFQERDVLIQGIVVGVIRKY